jgi:biotin carboxylase
MATDTRDIILTINVVEPGLINAIKEHGKRLGKDLKGLVLLDISYSSKENRKKDTTGFFKEIVCDFNDPNELQRVIKPYADRLLAVTCRYETAIEPFRKLIPFLPYIPTPSESSLVWALEKPLMRDRMRNYDERLVPKYQYFDSYDAAAVDKLTKDFTLPVIVKPAGLAESLLVTRCDTREEMHKCLKRTFAVIKKVYAREHRHTQPGLLVEEMMQGDMYSTDAYVTHTGEVFCLPLVKVVTAHSIGLPGFYSYRHILPVNLPEAEIRAAFDVSEAAIKALNLSATTTHIELFYTPQGWKVIELGARLGGYREALYREAYGIEHYYNDLAVRMGMEPIMPTTLIRHAAGMNMYAEEEGTIEAITGVEEAQKLESVVFVECHAKPGDPAQFAENGGKLIVDGIFSNKDADQLEADVAKARELIHIKVKK